MRASIIALVLIGCGGAQRSGAAKPCLDEAAVRPVPLTGAVATPEAELSGLAWWHDTLVLLPQYPARFDGVLFTVPAAALDAESIEPATLPFNDGGLAKQVEGFEGFEAIAIDGDRFWLTVELGPEHAATGYVVEGTLSAEGAVLELGKLERLPLPNTLPNKGLEAALPWQGGVLAIYEANEAESFAWWVGPHGQRRKFAMPALAFRLTDATAPDADGRFWATNYHWPEDRGRRPDCPLIDRYGIGCSQQHSPEVERLVPFDIGDQAIRLGAAPPRYLARPRGTEGRNFEGLVRYRGGFLAVTDKHPATMLVRIVAPGQ